MPYGWCYKIAINLSDAERIKPWNWPLKPTKPKSVYLNCVIHVSSTSRAGFGPSNKHEFPADTFINNFWPQISKYCFNVLVNAPYTVLAGATKVWKTFKPHFFYLFLKRWSFFILLLIAVYTYRTSLVVVIH